MKRTSLWSIPLLAGVAWLNQAQAVPCSDTTTGIFADAGFTTSASTACHDGTGANDPFPSSLTFGGTTYESIAKVENGTTNGTNSGGATVTASGINAPSGTWAITNPGTYTSFVIVLKDGVTGSGVQWSAYVVNYPTYTSGWWRYGQTAGGEYKDVSHISFYGVVGPVTVPEPTSLGLLGLGLVGVGLIRRRRKS